MDVTLVGVSASQGIVNHKPVAFGAVPAAGTPTGATGLLDVALDLPGDLQGAKIFQFRVKDTHVNADGDADCEHYGIVVYHRTGPVKQSGRP